MKDSTTSVAYINKTETNERNLNIYKKGKWFQYGATGAYVWRIAQGAKEPRWETLLCDWDYNNGKLAIPRKGHDMHTDYGKERIEKLTGMIDPAMQMVINLQYSSSVIPVVDIKKVIQDNSAGVVKVYVDWELNELSERASYISAGSFAIVELSHLPIEIVVDMHK